MTQKERKELDARNARSAQKVAWVTLVSGLLLSIGFNALSAYVDGFDPIGMAIAALPPLSLFVVSMLLERLKLDWVVSTALTLVSVVALAFSWYHIAMVVEHYHQPYLIAWSFPMILDIPMLLAGMSIMKVRNGQKPQPTSIAQTTAIKAVKAVPAKRTSRTKVAVVTA